jgi:hypothetical protein
MKDFESWTDYYRHIEERLKQAGLSLKYENNDGPFLSEPLPLTNRNYLVSKGLGGQDKFDNLITNGDVLKSRQVLDCNFNDTNVSFNLSFDFHSIRDSSSVQVVYIQAHIEYKTRTKTGEISYTLGKDWYSSFETSTSLSDEDEIEKTEKRLDKLNIYLGNDKDTFWVENDENSLEKILELIEIAKMMKENSGLY